MASRVPRIRMPKVSLPGRSSGRAAGSGKAKTAEAKSEAPTAEATAPKTAAGTATATPDPKLQERIEGLQGWTAELERRLGRLTYFGGAAVLIAIAAAGAALYFGLTAKSDSATKDDVDALTTKVDSLQSAVTKNTQDTQATLNDTVNRLQASITALQKQRAQDAANIATLQQQVAALNKAPPATPGAAAGAGAGAGATPTTPGAPKNP